MRFVDARALKEKGAISVVGHRVVHGGEKFTSATLIDDAVLDELEALSPLAPLHNPVNVAGIREARRVFPRFPTLRFSTPRFMPPCRARRSFTDCLTNFTRRSGCGAMASTVRRTSTSRWQRRSFLAAGRAH